MYIYNIFNTVEAEVWCDWAYLVNAKTFDVALSAGPPLCRSRREMGIDEKIFELK